jgi:hypothetical protein
MHPDYLTTTKKICFPTGTFCFMMQETLTTFGQGSASIAQSLDSGSLLLMRLSPVHGVIQEWGFEWASL